MMKKQVGTGIILLVCLFLLSACVQQQKQPIDSMPDEELRIISLSPSQTETLFALDLADSIIGVSDFCDYPEEATDKEPMGSSWTINLERVLELEPDLVFTYAGGQPDAVKQMELMGILVIDFSPESVEDVLDSILATGALTGREIQAESIVQQMIQERDEIVSLVEGRPRIPVFYQVWDDPLQTAGQGSFIHELIQLAGGDNIAGNINEPYPMYSVEALIENNPEIYFMPPHVVDFQEMSEETAEQIREQVRKRPGYDQILAIQHNRIELLEPNIASRPGVRVIEGLRLFAEAIHPEVF